jgi:protein involved in polysaccharide export with SLBB domain
MRHTIRQAAYAALLAGISLAAPGGGLSAQASPADGAVTLGPGDVVRITVWRKPELSGDFTILANGTIGHPLYQAVSARDTPIPVLTARLREFLATLEQNPQVVVEPLVRVAVGGEVRAPSLTTVPVGTTIGQAIAQAGGASERGNLAKVRLVREGRDQRIDLTSTRGGGATMPVRSGDEIYVGQRGNVFRDVIGPFASILGAAAAIVSATR